MLAATLIWAVLAATAHVAAATSAADLAYVLLGSNTPERDAVLHEALTSMRDNLLPSTPGDVLLFHTGEFSSGSPRLVAVRAILPELRAVRLPDSAWQLPHGFTDKDVRKGSHGIGYRHMCAWYANGVFHLLGTLGYKWVLRLDDDSVIKAKVKHNLVTWMEANGKHYGYRMWRNDGADVTWSLPELTAWYLTSREFQPVRGVLLRSRFRHSILCQGLLADDL